jgi:ribosome biogenesis GTPase A
MNFTYLERFVSHYNDRLDKKDEIFDETVTGTILKVQKELTDSYFLPSIQLKKLFEKLLRRSHYPMEIAISGQFSSGKSTFLNALLQKDILPTGITPVTSKVNFINYGDEYRLKVTYSSGHEAFHPIEDIAKFTDQRGDVEDIKYLTLYAPMDILKDISFVDTPGLNSLSDDDTTVTQKVLRDVDGIIWLTLLDNAGKESEAVTLKNYLSNFQNKSLCVLNQKDKFSKEQVDTTTAYVAQTFSDYFAKVIPISARQALESRQFQKEILIDDERSNVINSFKAELTQNSEPKDLTFFEQSFKAFLEEVKQIKDRDTALDLHNQEESNILAVIDFIEEEIRPQAITAKAHSLKKELISICDILALEYNNILSVYENLDEIHQESVITMKMQLEAILQEDSSEFFLIQEALHTILEEIASEIYKNIISYSKKRYYEKKSSFGKLKQEVVEYEAVKIDKNTILKHLFFDDEKIDKKVLRTMKLLQNIEDETSSSLRDIFETMKISINQWRSRFEYLYKQREIASDLEFANTRNFVSRVYENFLSHYHGSNEDSIAVMKKNFAFLKGSFSFNYRQVTQSSIAFFDDKIKLSIDSYEKDPTQFSLARPTKEEILQRLYSDFSIEKLDKSLTSKRSHIYNIITYAKKEIDMIGLSRTEFLKGEKEKVKEKIASLNKIKDAI